MHDGEKSQSTAVDFVYYKPVFLCLFLFKTKLLSEIVIHGGNTSSHALRIGQMRRISCRKILKVMKVMALSEKNK